MQPDEVEDRVGFGGLGELHRSMEGSLEDLREAGTGGVWLELRAGEGWGLHWAEEDRGAEVRGGTYADSGVGWVGTRKWGGVLVKLKGKGTD